MNIGSHYLGNGRCSFSVWAPFAENVRLKTLAPEERSIAMERRDGGYWGCIAGGVVPGTNYVFCLDPNEEKPDPASHFQPRGVHGPSEVVDHDAFFWEDSGWRGIEPAGMILYEMHIGTFTPGGTFEHAMECLEDLCGTGINTVSIMPVAQFPGERNWGYDGVYPYAVQNSYGGPQGLKAFVNACHRMGIAVILDVVYNHLGPEGNYFEVYAPYFTDKYRTPWGKAINFDGPHSDHVRAYFIGNALHWFEQYHIDGLRLDAIHSIFDMSAKPFLAELSEETEEFSQKDGRKRYLIAESNLNDTRILKQRNECGYELDAQWNDDFHHSLHALLTKDRNGYYADFGDIEDFRKSWREGFVLTWNYSRYRKRRHGTSAAMIPARRFVVCSQNHDQVGNRMHGDRLAAQISFEALKLAAGAVILSPYVPMLFMGEEYGEDAPFLYFVSHSDAELIGAIREGRKKEFSSFQWEGEPPDPQDTAAFERSRLNWHRRLEGDHGILHRFYQRLIRLRKDHPVISKPDNRCLTLVDRPSDGNVFVCIRRQGKRQILYIMNFDPVPRPVSLPEITCTWKKVIDSSTEEWNGPGARLPMSIQSGVHIETNASSIAVYEMEKTE